VTSPFWLNQQLTEDGYETFSSVGKRDGLYSGRGRNILEGLHIHTTERWIGANVAVISLQRGLVIAAHHTMDTGWYVRSEWTGRKACEALRR
jgi:hypothetical protein